MSGKRRAESGEHERKAENMSGERAVATAFFRLKALLRCYPYVILKKQ